MTQDDTTRWGLIAAIILGAFIVINIISFIWMPFLPWFQERQAGQETIEQTYDAEQAIQQYEEFRQLYSEIEEQRAQVANSRDALDRFYDNYGDPKTDEVNPSEDWTRQTRERHNRLQTRYTANKQQLENLVSDYNAMSRSANQELFKCQLPYQVDDRLEIRGPPGSGAAEEPIRDEGPNGEPINADADSIPEPSQCDGLPDEIQQEASNT